MKANKLFRGIKLKVIKWILVSIVLTSFFSCNKYNRKYVWGTIKYNQGITNDGTFELMEKTFYKSPYLGDTSMHKQTCDLYYVVINEKMKGMFAKNANDYDCIAHRRNDTLFIHISQSTGLSGNGLTITIVKNKYSIRPFEVSDNRIEGEEIYYPEIKSQDLVLNKPADSKDEYIYGTFYLHTKNRSGIVNYWSGEFKCKYDSPPIRSQK